ncbi:type I phosphomannose isomerase catalytic subunit [Fructilactobacillus carniphilus]|uniref:Mannose-6-phosphate isomerase n=1 Tax=Fructilactobacillus carniphilus TaxID=2940297 RepID=A0ABY5BW49_9LACO|nr:type I phosphomannose isomerase catalytic subunit [Fructilactobacillus carniphilus]USS90729.1 mannose-6-phosphate isomerase [Fructilactobacillus carniphilus]
METSETLQAQPLFLTPVLQPKIWGGDALHKYYPELQTKGMGESWAASTYGQFQSKVATGPCAGQTLQTVWNEHPELFAHPAGVEFPLLVKLLDAHENLSIQVHPDDQTARTLFHEPNGKTECWYILDVQPGARAYYGHRAQTQAELERAIVEHRLDDYLITRPVHPGEIIYVPGGTLHALGAGIVALEVEQSSDNTLRFYDFDRVDKQTGQKRPLQIEEALAATHFPVQALEATVTEARVDPQQPGRTEILRSQYFQVAELDSDPQVELQPQTQWSINVVIAGQGDLTVGDRVYPIHIGQTFVLPVGFPVAQLTGNLKIVQATV